VTAYYVRSGASGSANGTSWTNAYTTMAVALSGKAAGDIFYVSEDHSESTASTVTLTFQGTPSNPSLVYCVDHAGTVPPVSADLRTTGAVAVTGNNTLAVNGSAYFYGVQWKTGGGSSIGTLTFGSGNGNTQTHESCTFALNGTLGGNFAPGGAAQGSKATLINCTVTFASSSSSWVLRADLKMIGGSVALTGTVPTTLFSFGSGGCWSVVEFSGVDFSGLGSGKTLFGTSPTFSGYGQLRDCKVGASVTVASTPTYPASPIADLINCDSGATNYRNERYRYSGTQTTETTIVRSGGASDGTTPVAHTIVTTANATKQFPFESFPLAIWNDTVGSSVTVTVYGIWGGGAVPNNDDIWIEAEYLGSSSSPLGSFVSNGKADGLASNAALSSDSSTWGGSTTAFKMSVTFTPQQKGLVYITVKAAKASSTFYIDPKIELS
jgi:hypothetical protein